MWSTPIKRGSDKVQSNDIEQLSMMYATPPYSLGVAQHVSPPVVVAATRKGFQVGDLVEVTARTWPGINKPGGVGKISKVNDNGTYKVSYVLGGSEKEVELEYIKLQTHVFQLYNRPVKARDFYSDNHWQDGKQGLASDTNSEASGDSQQNVLTSSRSNKSSGKRVQWIDKTPSMTSMDSMSVPHTDEEKEEVKPVEKPIEQPRHEKITKVATTPAKSDSAKKIKKSGSAKSLKKKKSSSEMSRIKVDSNSKKVSREFDEKSSPVSTPIVKRKRREIPQIEMTPGSAVKKSKPTVPKLTKKNSDSSVKSEPRRVETPRPKSFVEDVTTTPIKAVEQETTATSVVDEIRDNSTTIVDAVASNEPIVDESFSELEVLAQVASQKEPSAVLEDTQVKPAQKATTKPLPMPIASLPVPKASPRVVAAPVSNQLLRARAQKIVEGYHSQSAMNTVVDLSENIRYDLVEKLVQRGVSTKLLFSHLELQRSERSKLLKQFIAEQNHSNNALVNGFATELLNNNEPVSRLEAVCMMVNPHWRPLNKTVSKLQSKAHPLKNIASRQKNSVSQMIQRQEMESGCLYNMQRKSLASVCGVPERLVEELVPRIKLPIS